MGSVNNAVAAAMYANYEHTFVAESDVRATEIAAILGAAASAELLKKIAKFVRCNSYADVYAAATQTSDRLKKSHGGHSTPVHVEPWEYCVAVANGQWARTRDIFMRLAIYEHALRNRVALTLDLHLGNNWWDDPTLYMRQSDAYNLYRENHLVSEFRDSGAEKIRPFASSATFMPNLFLPELHTVVTYLWTNLFQFLFKGWNLTEFLDATKSLETARRNTMHARPSYVTPNNRLVHVKRLNRLLVAMEFDVDKTVAGINSAKLD
jgi:hypothetical protein